MMHALIIGAERSAVDMAIDGLWNEGYQSIFHVDRVAEAFPLLTGWHPSVIFVLPDAVAGASAAELRRFSEAGDAPVVAARQDLRRSFAFLGPNEQAAPMSLAA